ncbi:MAG: iron-siderophore ABC transporter substrate-binding protein [Thermoleophilaceae bacterium]|nr:iron-siderophore ABC transporter substrate-binding protein [Thermoleophilaceae bacterium]
MRLIRLALLPALAGLVLLPAAAAGAPKRIVSIEWENTENLLALGIKPVGIADAETMSTWTPIVPPKATDVGSRIAPNIERIASLEPDLIVVTTRGGAPPFVRQLRQIAKTLVLDQYAGKRTDGSLYDAMIRGLRRTAAAVGRRARGETVIRSLESTYAKLRKRIKRKGRAGDRVVFSYPWGAPGRPMVQLATDNGMPATVLRRLGLRNPWHGQRGRYGFTRISPEGLVKVQKADWVLFPLAREFREEFGQVTSQPFFNRLDFVKRGRFRTLAGNTWPYGGPLSAKVLAQRVAGAITR